LAKARRRTRASFARKLKVSKKTIRRSERRSDVYLSAFRQTVEQKGGNLRLEVKFPDQPPVILAGFGGDDGGTKAQKKVGSGAKSKPKTRRAA
jgi:hypothetical protein